jgi:hypothetical protein
VFLKSFLLLSQSSIVSTPAAAAAIGREKRTKNSSESAHQDNRKKNGLNITKHKKNMLSNCHSPKGQGRIQNRHRHFLI